LKEEFLIRRQSDCAALVLVITVPDEGIASMVEDPSSVDLDCREEVENVGDAVSCEGRGQEFLNRIDDGIEERRVVDLGVGGLL